MLCGYLDPLDVFEDIISTVWVCQGVPPPTSLEVSTSAHVVKSCPRRGTIRGIRKTASSDQQCFRGIAAGGGVQAPCRAKP